MYTRMHILEKWDHGVVVQGKVCLRPRAAITVCRSAVRAFLPWRHSPRIQVTGKSITAVYLSEWKLKIRWGGVTPTWQSGKVPAERMKSLPKVIKLSPIYFSRAMTFYNKGGCDPVFFLCVVFLFMGAPEGRDCYHITPCSRHEDLYTCYYSRHTFLSCSLGFQLRAFISCSCRDKPVSLILPISIVL